MNIDYENKYIRLKKKCASLNRKSEIFLGVAAFFMILVLVFPRDTELSNNPTDDKGVTGPPPIVEEVLFTWTPDNGLIYRGNRIRDSQVIKVLDQFENPKPVVQLPNDRALFAVLKQSEIRGKSVTFRTVQK